MKILSFLVLAIALYSCSSSLSKSSEGAIEIAEPKSLYIMHCASCHGEKGDQGTSGAANLKLSKISDNQILKVIENGNRKGMMPYKDIIQNKEERLLLVDYVKSLRK
jgi:cytochrome c551